MLKRVFFSGVAGFVAITVWTAVANVGFGLTARLAMNRVSDEQRVHSALMESVPAPGAYVVNPPSLERNGPPQAGPVFSVSYAGFGHEAAGRMALFEALTLLLCAMLAAAALSMASPHVLAHYSSRVLFISLLGLFVAVGGDLGRYGIGGHPLSSALLFAANTMVSWTLAGLVMATVMRPQRKVAIAA